MYKLVETWMDNLELDNVPEEVTAFNFNLYDDGDDLNWSMDLIGAPSFDLEDPDWACFEVTDFNSREPSFQWTEACDWETAYDRIVNVLKEYLEKGKYAPVLKGKTAVAVGFDSGDLEILFMK